MKKVFIGVGVAALCLSSALVIVACNKDKDTNVYVTTEAELVSAVTEAKANDVIVLNANIVLTDQLDVSKKITLDMNGKTISNTQAIWNEAEGVKDWSLISVVENGELTIKGNGKFSALENDCFALDIRGGKCVIENSAFIGNISAVYVYAGNLQVKGGEFSIQQLVTDGGDAYRETLNRYDAHAADGTATITVSGGKFYQFNPANTGADGANTNYLANGFVSTADGDYFVVSASQAE